VLMSYSTLDATFPAIMEDKAMGSSLTEATASRVFAIGSLAYVISKLFLGFIVDIIGGKKGIMITLFFVSLAVASFGIVGYSSTIFPVLLSNDGFAIEILMIAVWGFARFCMSAGWPSIVRLVAGWFAADKLGFVIGVLSVSAEIGYLIGKFSFGLLLFLNVNWKVCFFIAGAYAIAVVVLDTILIRGTYDKLYSETETVVLTIVEFETNRHT